MLWILLFAYQIKHFLADYPLQGKFMLGKFAKFPDFVLPLLAHAGVHAAFTFAIALTLKPAKVALALALFDATVHFVVDRVKASPDLLGRFKALNKKEYMEEIAPVLADWEKNGPAGPGSPREQNYLDTLARVKSNTYFWWALGWDQMMHHLTHYIIIWALLP